MNHFLRNYSPLWLLALLGTLYAGVPEAEARSRFSSGGVMGIEEALDQIEEPKAGARQQRRAAALFKGYSLLTNPQMRRLASLLSRNIDSAAVGELIAGLDAQLVNRQDPALTQEIIAQVCANLFKMQDEKNALALADLMMKWTEDPEARYDWNVTLLMQSQVAQVRYEALARLMDEFLKSDEKEEEMSAAIFQHLQTETTSGVAVLCCLALGDYTYKPALQRLESIANDRIPAPFIGVKSRGHTLRNAGAVKASRYEHGDVKRAAQDAASAIRQAYQLYD
jgi:hypothetical protein